MLKCARTFLGRESATVFQRSRSSARSSTLVPRVCASVDNGGSWQVCAASWSSMGLLTTDPPTSLGNTTKRLRWCTNSGQVRSFFRRAAPHAAHHEFQEGSIQVTNHDVCSASASSFPCGCTRPTKPRFPMTPVRNLPLYDWTKGDEDGGASKGAHGRAENRTV